METLDWAQIIADLRGKRMSQAEIGQVCGMSQAFVSDLYRGARTDLMYSRGAKLLQLWREQVNPPVRLLSQKEGSLCQDRDCSLPHTSARK